MHRIADGLDRRPHNQRLQPTALGAHEAPRLKRHRWTASRLGAWRCLRRGHDARCDASEATLATVDDPACKNSQDLPEHARACNLERPRGMTADPAFPGSAAVGLALCVASEAT